ncbi:MAG: Methyltransferase type 11 [Patescibacteria group bacterium]|nr:Methyltransferase type 11 [Patescibacteria group bacterium]
MDQDAQKNYFEIAYRTGSDVWTHIPYHAVAMRMLPPLAKDSFILDIGVGRGLWLHKLVAAGFRVIGLDYVADIVRKGNLDLKSENLGDRARFVVGDVTDIPLADSTFDCVTDIGVLQHMASGQRIGYMSEVARVLKSGGYVLNVSLSKETQRFLGFKPKHSADASFEKFGVSYYFFTNDELNGLFLDYGMKLVDQRIEHFDARTDPDDSIALVMSLYKKD